MCGARALAPLTYQARKFKTVLSESGRDARAQDWAPEFGGRKWVLRVRDWPSQNGVLSSRGKGTVSVHPVSKESTSSFFSGGGKRILPPNSGVQAQDTADAHYGLGLSALCLHDYAKAVPHFERASCMSGAPAPTPVRHIRGGKARPPSEDSAALTTPAHRHDSMTINQTSLLVGNRLSAAGARADTQAELGHGAGMSLSGGSLALGFPFGGSL